MLRKRFEKGSIARWRLKMAFHGSDGIGILE